MTAISRGNPAAGGMRVINNRYALQREIGRGSSGSVWLARDEVLGRGVAIKLLDRSMVDAVDGYPALHHEARLAAQLRSPHIVQVYDLGEDEGQMFIVMELLEGESLDVRLARRVRMPLRTTCRFVTEVAQGLTQIHAAQIVHRDLKPANIFIAREATREVVKLLDFGISSVRPSPVGDQGQSGVWPMLGTPQYMGPEQFAGQCDHRTDLWSLAVIAFQMLTGVAPFTGRNLAELRHQVRHGSFQRPAALDSELGAFFERALAKDPEERFQSAGELSLALSRIDESRMAGVTRVLIVDDEEDMQMLMRQKFRKQLRSGTFELSFALSGETGLVQLREHDVDVVLTDINMPGMGGLAFIERALEVNPIARVVVVSAYGDMSNIRAAMNKGAFDFIEKPIDFEDLQRTVEKCASHVSLLRDGVKSIEENQIMRMLVGQGTADEIIREVKALQAIAQLEREATVLFIDFYASAAVAADETVEATFERLNAHFSRIVPEILAHNGKVIRLAGDALFCVFEGDAHLERALLTCDSIRDRVRWVDAATSEPDPPREVSFGLDTGRVFSGGLGSAMLGRLEHATIGHPVGVAHHLYGMAERGELLVSDEVRKRIERDYACDPIVDRVLNTRLGPVSFFRVLGKLEEGSESEQRRLGGDSVATQPLVSNQ